MIQGTAGNQPTVQFNEAHGLPVVQFDGTDDFLSIAAMTNGMSGNAAHTVFLVVKNTGGDTGSNQVIFNYGSTLSNGKQTRFNWNHSSNTIRWSYYSGNEEIGGLETQLMNETTLISGYAPGTGDSTNKVLYVNGSSSGQTTVSTTTLNLNATDMFKLGALYQNAEHFSGQIMEVIVYKSALSNADREAVESYLRAKWQKGVDGISTNNLVLHADPMKRGTIKTDTNATSCDTTTHTTATDNDDVSCILDRSPQGNNVGQATIGDRPDLDTDGANNFPTLIYTDDTSILT